MQIDKDQVISFLQQRGDDANAEQAREFLTDQVNTEKDAGLRAKFGIDRSELLGGLGGGMGDKLGL